MVCMALEAWCGLCMEKSSCRYSHKWLSMEVTGGEGESYLQRCSTSWNIKKGYLKKEKKNLFSSQFYREKPEQVVSGA